MPNAAPIHKYAGQRTHSQLKADSDKRRSTDKGRLDRKALYNSFAWKRLRAYLFTQDPFCVMCRAQGITKAWAHLDHIIDLADGGEPLDVANLQGLCHSHHSTKTGTSRSHHSGAAP
jgi:hypothetical protein